MKINQVTNKIKTYTKRQYVKYLFDHSDYYFIKLNVLNKNKYNYYN